MAIPYGVQITNASYGPVTQTTDNSNQNCQIYTPIGASGARPCIVFIHGGGWLSGGYGTYQKLGPKLASLGYVCCAINYRWSTNSSYALPWPTQIVDCQLAVRWLRANAPTYNINPNQIVTWGDSAGSHLALYLLVYSGIHAANGSDTSGSVSTLTSYSSQVQACVDAFGPADLVTTYNNGDSAAKTDIPALLGGTPSQVPSTYSDASVTNNISRSVGPVYILQGTSDTTVSPLNTGELYALLQVYNSPVTYIPYAGGHEFAGLTQAQINTLQSGAIQFIQGQFPVS